MGKARKPPVGRNMSGGKRQEVNSKDYKGPTKQHDGSIGRDALGRKQDFNSVPWPKWKDQARDKYGRWT